MKNKKMITNNKVVDLLDRALEKGISVFLDGEKLRLKMNKNKPVDKEFIQELKMEKEAIYAFLDKEVKRFDKEQNATPNIIPFERNSLKTIPLSFSQQRLWFIDKLQGSVQYHMPSILPLDGAVDQKNLEDTFQAIINRHEVLRTVFKEIDGEPYQEILGEDNWSLDYTDLSNSSETAIEEWIEKEIALPFDLSKDHLLRAHLVKVPDQHLLVWVMHHIASDGWSMQIFEREMMELWTAKLENRPAQLPALDIQYADYAVWQRTYLNEGLLDKKLTYWKVQLKGVEALNLPTDFTRPAIQSIRGRGLTFDIGKNESAQLNQLARKQEVTLFMLLLTIIKIWLHKYSGQEDICIGSPIANRTKHELDPLIGCFLNTLALRSSITGQTSFSNLLAQVKAMTLEAYTHQDVPFEKIVDKLVKTRDISSTPIFQVLFTLQNNETFDQPLEGIEKETKETDQFGLEMSTVKFDLTIDISENEDGINVHLGYCVDLFRHSTIKQLAQHFKTLVKSVLQNEQSKIMDLSMLSQEERALILGQKPTKAGQWFNKGFEDLGNTEPINVRFERMVDARPNAIAVVHEEEEWTYRETNDFANQIAHVLQQSGLNKGDFVGIFMDRSPALIAALLGVLKCGAVYVPIDTQNSTKRSNKMIQNSGMSYIITVDHLLDALEEGNLKTILLLDQAAKTRDKNIKDLNHLKTASKANLPNENTMDSWAYMLYTSGTTGEPKGAITRHDGAMNHILAEYKLLDLPDGFRFLQSAGIGSDISVWQILAPLLKGGTAIIVDKDTLLEFDQLIQLWENKALSIVEFVPSYIWNLLEHIQEMPQPPSFKSLLWIMMVGEEIPVELVNKWKALFPNVRILNGYGPCEASDDICQYEITSFLEKQQIRVPIGRSLPNMNMYVLAENGGLCPIGVPGELCVSGVGVGAGYYGQEEKTKASFVKNPFEETLGNVMYKTGDMGRWLPDGNLDFLGRKDRQIKIRGHRVELGEIESCLRQVAQIKEVHVMVQKNTDNHDFLAAYIVLQDAIDATPTDLQETLQKHCKNSLAVYMQPSYYCFIETMPTNLSDKIDEKQLQQFFKEQDTIAVRKENLVAPRNELESQLLTIWSTLLKVSSISINDDFFSVGGHSLLATRVASAIRKQLKLEVAIVDLFTYTTIESLARFLNDFGVESNLPSIEKQERPKQIPLSFSQERLWFIDKLQGSTSYHMPMVLRLKGNVNKEYLEESFNAIVNRHEVLRTVFREEEGKAYQYILPPDSWEMDTTMTMKEIVPAIIQSEIDEPFDLANDHLLRANLLEISEEEKILVLVVHHIAFDGWSQSILIEELMEQYVARLENRPPVLPDLGIQFADYAMWQRNYFAGEVLDQKLKFWEDRLSGVQPLQLPLDFQRPAIQSTTGQLYEIVLDQQAKEGLEDLAKAQNVSLFILMLALYKIMLNRFSGQEDICVGTTIANRIQSEVEPLIGFFSNTIALRSDLSNHPTFTTFLNQVNKNTLEAYQNQGVPFDKIVSRVDRERDRSRSSVYQTTFIMNNNPEDPILNLKDLQLIPEPFDFDVTKYDLSFYITPEIAGGLSVTANFCKDLFKQSTIADMVEHFENLIREVLTNRNATIDELNGKALAKKTSVSTSMAN